MNYWLIIAIPLIAALIGWLTNLIAVKILFHPVKPKTILGLRFQGIIPARQKQFSEMLGNLISAEFFSSNFIEEQINDPANLQKIIPVIENHIDDFLRNRLAAEIPVVGMFVGDKTIGVLKQAFMKEFESLFPLVMKQYANNLKTKQDPAKMLTDKIANLSVEKLEKTIFRKLSKQLRYLEILGAVTGFAIGILVALIVIFI